MYDSQAVHIHTLAAQLGCGFAAADAKGLCEIAHQIERPKEKAERDSATY